MIGISKGELYIIDIDKEIPWQEIYDFYSQGHEDDIIQIRKRNGVSIYINRNDVCRQMVDGNNRIRWKADVNFFREAASNPHAAGGIPVLDADENPICFLKDMPSYYQHQYGGDLSRLDTSVFELYEAVCLNEFNEYSYLMLTECLNRYQGKVFLFGSTWEDWLSVLRMEQRPHVEYVPDERDLAAKSEGLKVMNISYFLSNVDGYLERCKKGLFSYDEIMLLLYCFTYHKTLGSSNPDKRLYGVDGVFGFQGLISVCDKLSVPYAYLTAKGYTPVIGLVSSDRSVYSDFAGDDIWGKFFIQPSGFHMEDLASCADVTFSPNFNVTFSAMYLMKQLTDCGRFELVTDRYFNDNVSQTIAAELEKMTLAGKRVLGVLARGTDYKQNKPKGHPIQASVSQLCGKIREFESQTCYDYIYVATEDSDIIAELKAIYGDRLRYTNQLRYTVKEGQYLSHTRNERLRDGWLRGVEYLTSITILSKCDALISSGRCMGTAYALHVNGGKYKETFVFDLGKY